MAIRGSKISKTKRFLKSRKNPVRERVSKSGRKNYIKNLARKHGVSTAIKKLKNLARKNPEHSDEIMKDALWLVNADTSGVVPESPEINAMLRNNPDFDWGPKLFNPLEDDHPFEKNRKRKNPSEEIGGGLFTSIYNRRRGNPQEDIGGLFTPIYNRRNRRNP